MLKILGWVDGDTNVVITDIGREMRARLSKSVAISFRESMRANITNNHNRTCGNTVGSISIGNLVEGSEPGSFGSSKRIMIVDDEPDILLTYETFLSGINILIKSFSDSYQALQEFILNPKSYDLIVLDIRMKRLNGLQLYQIMKVIYPNCRIVFISALDAAKEITSTMPGISPQNVLRKPVDRDQFLTIVKAIL